MVGQLLAGVAVLCVWLWALDIPASASSGGPDVLAPAAALIEADTGAVIYEKSASQPRAIASTTKLMTAYVALRHAPLWRVLTVQPYRPAPEETVAGIVAGERLSVSDLLKAMLLPSGGDAANTLAVDLGGGVSRFVGWMNAAARRLGMRHTHYSTPVGLDTPGNYSTAGDLAHLARALMRDAGFAAIVDMPSARLRSGLVLPNLNDLVGRYWYVIGIKTGHTSDAGYCLVGAARRRGATVISVVLGEGSEAARDRDSLALLNDGLSLYRRVELITAGHVYARVPVSDHPGVRLALVARRSVSLIVRAGSKLDVYRSGVPSSVHGPLAPHIRLAKIIVRQNGRIVARVALVSRVGLAPGAAADAPAA
ncbi:MAG TPA: D-alanyl-D-alanine carboxypeptidase family protein [Solirubrobacteraceae bacterium]|jgi:D-alanyl-D-alanine carboxypeptidase (penicillin-binding protein 5/6)